MMKLGRLSLFAPESCWQRWLLLLLVPVLQGCALSYYYPAYTHSERQGLEWAEGKCYEQTGMAQGILLDTCVLEVLSEQTNEPEPTAADHRSLPLHSPYL
ncbi:MAG: hypothetical protein L0Z68_07040 [Gammaproteobacteria bacterium]|nr:hypothetical protein [Gammaproteobacteria bacterium]